MCGICGLLSPRGASAPDFAAATAMNDALTHRGPDDAAVERFGRCVLAYRRLAVLDLAPTGRQPVTNETGDVHATLNGELYNFPQLRSELKASGHDLPGTGDTQVLPHLYEEEGPRFVERLEGMFALALWDSARERLVLARDRVGKKPLLWTRLPDGTIAWGSELKALATLPGFRRDVDLRALDAYLALQYVPGPETAVRNVHRLPPGHLLVAENGDVHVERWWSPKVLRERATDDEWLERVRAEVRAAVRRRLVSDVPLGALLSGGIDSSIVVALLADEAAGRVRTFSVGFTDTRYDERSYARLVAERYGTQHEELLVEPDAAALLPKLAWAFDEPFGDSSALPTFIVCEYARRSITVALTGDGGDEAFGGYERYVAHGAARHVPAPVAARAAAALRRIPGGRGEPRSPAFRAARFLETAAAPPNERYGRLMEIFPEPLRTELWTDDARAEIGESPATADLLGPLDGDGVGALQRLDVVTYLPGDLLVKADIASMANSLELRAPFLDHRVLELGLSLPDRLKARGRRGKIALRRAFSDLLPREIASRPKQGFGVPVSRWFRGELRELAGDLLLDGRVRSRGQLRVDVLERLLREHTAGEVDHGARLWSLVMLELWQRFYVEAQRPPAEAVHRSPVLRGR